MANYSGSIDISVLEDLTGQTIVSVKTIYYSSTYKDVDKIPEPLIANDSATKVLRFSDGILKVDDKPLSIVVPKSQWSYEKPEFLYGFHLWTSMEITTLDSTVIYSEPVLSAEWESYYNIDIGGRNLIRNSKTLIDNKIFWD